MKSINVSYVITEVREVTINYNGDLTIEQARDLFWDNYYNNPDMHDVSDCVQCGTEIKYIDIFDENGNVVE
jgi:hypothetical protein